MGWYIPCTNKTPVIKSVFMSSYTMFYIRRSIDGVSLFDAGISGIWREAGGRGGRGVEG